MPTNAKNEHCEVVNRNRFSLKGTVTFQFCFIPVSQCAWCDAERAEAAAEGAGGKTQEKAGTIFYEYVLIGGVNDADEHAHQLGELLKGRKAILNVIPWNATAAGGYMGYTSPPPGRIEEFSSIVKDTHGVFCTVRREMGSDIACACGQLVVERTGGNRPRRNGGTCSSAAVDRALADIEDLAVARG